MGERGPPRGAAEMPLRTDEKRQERFLEALAETGSLIESARRASPHSEHGCVSTFKSFMRDDPTFAAKVQESLDAFRDSLIRAAVQRGRDGVDRPIFQKGELVGHERQYSDNLLLAELRKHFPSDYSEKHQHDHRVMIQPSGCWQISADDLAHLSQQERQQLAALMDRVRDGRGERRAIEHQSGDVVDADFEEVDNAEIQEAENLW